MEKQARTLILYEKKDETGKRILFMGPMMALCLKNEKDNEDIAQIAHREKDYKLKNLLETCNHTYRFHGKNII